MNLKRLSSLRAETEFYSSDAAEALKRLGASKRRFDIIFLDPPYYRGLIKKCLINLGRYDILKHSSLTIAEHFKKDIVPEEVGGLRRIREARYGDTILSFYVK